MADVEVVATGLKFPEGPIALPDGSVILVEIAAGRLSRVYPDGRIEVVAETGGGPNGAAYGPDGRIYVCNNGGFDVAERDGQVRILETLDDYVGGSIQARRPRERRGGDTVHRGRRRAAQGPERPRLRRRRVASGSPTTARPGPARSTGAASTTLAPGGKEVREMAFPLSTAPTASACRRRRIGSTWPRPTPAVSVVGGSAGPACSTRPTVAATQGSWWSACRASSCWTSLAVDGDGHVCVATIRNGGITDIDPAERRDRARAHRRSADHQHLLRRTRPPHGLHHLLPHAGRWSS